MLPDADTQYLSERGGSHEIFVESGMVNVLLHEFAIPAGLLPAAAQLLIRLATGYPDVAPDMWWFDPPVKCADGRAIPATEVTETYMGRAWQRWSRHLQASQWKPGQDGLESYLAIIRRDLEKWAKPA